MALLYIGVLIAWIVNRDASWVLFLLLGIAGAQALSLGLSFGALNVAGLRVDDEERQRVFSSALAIWTLIFCALLAAIGAPVLMVGWDNALSRFDPRVALAALTGVFVVLMALGHSACVLRGRGRGATAVWVFLGAVAVGATRLKGVELLIIGGAAALCALAMWGIAWIKPGAVKKDAMRAVIARGRPEWILHLLYALPGAIVCGFEKGLLPGYIIGMVFLLTPTANRLDDEDSRRRLAWSAICAVPVFALLPWAALWLDFAPYAGVMLAWALTVHFLPTLSSRVARYGWIAVLLFACSAAAGWVSWPYGGLIALIPLGLVLVLLRRFIYSAWLPIRARFVRRK